MTQKWIKTVTYEIDAIGEVEAEEVWMDDGPELADTGRIRVAAESEIEPGGNNDE